MKQTELSNNCLKVMALRNTAALKAAWARKAQNKPNATLGISHEAATIFARQTLKITNISISKLIFDHYLIDSITDLRTRILAKQRNPSAQLIESIKLITGIIATHIKKNSTTGPRIEQENDFLICVEVFAEGLGLTPSDDLEY